MPIDAVVHDWFQSHRHAAATACMLLAAWVHSTAGLLSLTAVLAAAFWHHARRRAVAVLLCSVPGAMLLNVAVKNIVQRPRPVVLEPLVVLSTYSFPSGHAAGATALYTFVLLWLWPRCPSRRGRAALVAGTAGMVAWVDVSRVYLGVHFLSDVLAGSALGAVWVMVCFRWLAAPRG